MLVLVRRRLQRISIGDDIVVTVLRTDRGTVRLGIEAPPEVRVRRGELSVCEPACESGGVLDGAVRLGDAIRQLDLGPPRASE